MSSPNYKIFNLDLSAEIDLISYGTSAYCIFWFRSIPLGERYYQKLVINNSFWKDCLDCIWPTLQSYQNKKELAWIEKPAQVDQHTIQSLCEKILKQNEPQPTTQTCDLSLVICTRNRANTLKNCLKQLALQYCKPAEVIVVDNASSSDDTKNVVSQFPEVRYIREDRPGLDIARNTGARAAKHSIIAYTDDDTLPNPYWIYRVFETFKDPSVDAMTGLVLAASLETEAEVIFEKYWPFNRGYIRKTYDNNFFVSTLNSGPPVWEIGAGANMAFRKDLFQEVGYFDERLDVGAAGCSGDSELWYRILANNFRIVYNPLAVVKHNHRNSIEGLKKQLYAYMRGFTVAILIQHARFGHKGNLQHLFKIVPSYYLSLLVKGFPFYNFQYRTLFSEISGIFSGMIYYLRKRNTNANIYS